MIVQVVTCINMLAAHEAESVAEKTGLNFTALQQVLRSSSAQSFVVDNWLDRFKLAGDPMEIRPPTNRSISKKPGTRAGNRGATRFVVGGNGVGGTLVAAHHGH